MYFPIPKINEFFRLSTLINGIISIYGDFGIGKTTLALQVALKAAEKGARVIFLYTKPIFPLQKLHDLSFKFKALNALDNLND
ncbi:MAG: hypothetical protein ACTSUN_09065, partial [Promethearchaeota archaeon]